MRQRMSRDERYAQLVEVAWSIVRADGVDALTLGRLAEHAGITKPVVYSHFPSRNALLASLNKEYDDRQHEMLTAALDAGADTLDDRAAAIADSYVGCVIGQGRELAGVLAALEGSPELERVKRECDDAYLARCREILAPFAGAGGLAPASLTAVFGAAESLSRAAASGELAEDVARSELTAVITAVVGRPTDTRKG